MQLSVIIPSLNEADLIGAAVGGGLSGGACEVIVADGGSTDRTAQIARAAGAVVIDAPRGRGRQLNAGAARARGEALLFLHADTRLPGGFAGLVREALGAGGVSAGAFRLRIDAPHRALRLIEKAVNWRTRRLGLPYGDQGIFMPRETFDRVGGFPDADAMEDFEIARRLRRLGRIAIVDADAVTSARRWLRHGILRTTLLNQACVAAYLCGVSPGRIAGWRNGRQPSDRRCPAPGSGR